MSLQLIAKQMEAKGRKGDSMLVHMTPGEVAGLQKLAESAGGSLSVNPETGLVEANFLKQMLPTLVGAGVGFFTANPMLGAAAGAAVGGFQARRSDQDVLTGMLMGGMGGYGGATIGSGISAAGAPATVGADVAKNTAANIPLQQAAQAQAQAVQAQQAQAMQQAAMAEGANLSGAEAAMLNTRRLPVAVAPTVAPAAAQTTSVIPGPTAPVTPPARTFADLTTRERMDQGLRGLKALGTKEGRDVAYKDIGGSEGLIRAATFGAMPYLNAAPTESAPQGIHPLLSSRIDRSIPNQSVEAYKGRMPRYTGGKNNVYAAVPTFRAADGGSIGGDSDARGGDAGGDPDPMSSGYALGNRVMQTSPTMQKLFGQLSPRTLERLGIARQEEVVSDPAPVLVAPELRAYEPEMPQYAYGNGTYIPTFRAAQGGITSLAAGGAFEDIQAYEGVMPNYSYVNGNFLRAATQPRIPMRPQGLLAGLLSPEVSQPRVVAPVIRPPVPQPMMETGRGDGYTPNADFVTPEQQAAFYAENPAMGRFTRTLQDYNPFASLQERMVPGFVQDQRNITYGPYSSQDLYSDNSVERNMNPTTDQGDLYNDNSVERTGVPEGVTLGGPAPAAELQGTSIDGYSPTSDDTSIGGFFAKGGLMGLAKGGLKEGGFVVPADVVAFLGGGNSDNGAEKIERMFPNAMYIDGPDGGQEDTVKTSIEGKQPARVAHGEVYIPPQDVKRAGGAKVLYAMLDRVRVAATGSKKQIKPVSLERAMA